MDSEVQGNNKEYIEFRTLVYKVSTFEDAKKYVHHSNKRLRTYCRNKIIYRDKNSLMISLANELL